MFSKGQKLGCFKPPELIALLELLDYELSTPQNLRLACNSKFWMEKVCTI